MTRFESRLFLVQLLCFTLLFQSTGIAQALPERPEKKSWVTQEDVADPGRGEVRPKSSISLRSGGLAKIGRFWAKSREFFGDAWKPLEEWIASGRPTTQSEVAEAFPVGTENERTEPPQVASLAPSTALLAASFAVQDDERRRGQGTERPPSPPRRSGSPRSLAMAAMSLKATGPDVSLLAGLNLVSIPAEPPVTDPAVVLGPIAGQITAAFAYDACDAVDPWKVYDPADLGGSDLTAIDHTHGLWIDATTVTVLPVVGTQPATTQIQLCTGWNLIGYPLAQARPVPAALASIAGKYVRVFGFDIADAEDPWEVFSVGVPAFANDLELMQPGRGYCVLVTEDTVLDYENVGAPPEVEISAPADISDVTAPTDVIGTIQSNSLDRWALSYRPSGEPGTAFVEVGAGNVPGTALTLGSFDPTLLLNGIYDLKLEAVDFAGHIVENVISVAVDGQMKIGNFRLTFRDLSIPLSGLDIDILRTYDSRDKQKRDFGVGWTLDILQGSYRNNRSPGEGWQIVGSPLPCQAVQETLSHLTTLRLSDREVYRFRLRLFSPASVIGGCFASARFDFVDGPLPGSTVEILGNTDVIYQNGSNLVIDADTLEVFKPEQVRLTTLDGRIFDFTLDDGVVRIEDAKGNTLLLSEFEIVHSGGRSVILERDADGRIRRIVDPMGNAIQYEYDAQGDLATVTDQEGRPSRYRYDGNHLLLEYDDARGLTPLRNEYDEQGRLVRQVDSNGKTIQFGHDLAARQEVIIDRLGQTRLVEYDELGNQTREVDESGGVTLRTFDSRGNRLSETDPLGNATTFAYDANNNLTQVVDPQGGTQAHSYDASGRILTSTDPAGNVTSNTYDARGNPLTTTDPLGNTTTSTYDSRGNLTSKTDPLGQLTRYEYDAFGNGTKTIDPLGNERSFTYDANGNRLTETRRRTTATGAATLVTTFVYDRLNRLVSVVDPDGTATAALYDALGNPLQITDKLGQTTILVYDAFSRLVERRFPDGTIERITHDAEGRRVSEIDRAGRTTSFSLDPVGRVVATTFPDGAVESQVFDAAGRQVAVLDARGNETRWEYDALGRGTRVIDPLGNALELTYDANGNAVSFRDARGEVTAFEYDALNRLTRIALPDGLDRRFAYDAAGRLISRADEAGETATLTYDARGGLIGVEDSLAGETAYAYDEVGNRTSQTDARGRVTAFEYDALGRLQRRVLPDGAAESFSYDAEGRLTQHGRSDGGTLQLTYDVNGRLVEKLLPDGSSVAFTYTPSGQRASAVDSRGTSAYAYDTRDRLLELADPAGRRLTYSYDLAGNRTSLAATTSTLSLVTTYAYDALNRLQSVTDPNGDIYQFSYDPNGNRAGLQYPNGAETSYAYDALNRLTTLATADDVGLPIQRFEYELGPVGNRTRVTEGDGTVRSFAYDALYRLTGETVTEPTAAVTERTYAYDAVGNRLSLTTTDSTGTSGVTYAYDIRDRLASGAGATYSWDVNGNLIQRTDNGTTSYSWDTEDRLVELTTDDGTVVQHTYDADGHRVRTEVTPAGGTTGVIDYLVDVTGEVSQVVLETDGTGSLMSYYVRGDGLLGVIRPAGSRFVHHDGLGSVRTLTDAAAAVTDRFAFSAFGELEGHDGTDPLQFLFAGEQLEPNSGFYDLRARWMDPRLGIFASMDPFMGSVFDPMTLHKYLYAAADPVNKTDPTGMLVSAAEFMLVGAIIGLLVTQVLIQTMGPNLTLGERFLILFVGAALGAALGALYAGAVGVGGLSAGAVGAAGGAGAAGAGAVQRLAQFDWSRAGHIFRNARGHVNPVLQTTKERFAQLFETVASNPNNLRTDFPLPPGAQQAGIQVFTQVFQRGQVWVFVRNGVINNAGVNRPGAFR